MAAQSATPLLKVEGLKQYLDVYKRQLPVQVPQLLARLPAAP